MNLDRLPIHYYYVCYKVDNQYCHAFSTEDIHEEFYKVFDVLYTCEFYYHPSPLWHMIETYAQNSKDWISINQTGKHQTKYCLWDNGEILDQYPMREENYESPVLYRGL